MMEAIAGVQAEATDATLLVAAGVIPVRTIVSLYARVQFVSQQGTPHLCAILSAQAEPPVLLLKSALKVRFFKSYYKAVCLQ